MRRDVWPDFAVCILYYPGANPDWLVDAVRSVAAQSVHPGAVVLVKNHWPGGDLGHKHKKLIDRCGLRVVWLNDDDEQIGPGHAWNVASRWCAANNFHWWAFLGADDLLFGPGLLAEYRELREYLGVCCNSLSFISEDIFVNDSKAQLHFFMFPRDFWLKNPTVEGKPRNLDQPIYAKCDAVYVYRIHGNNISHNPDGSLKPILP
jgi:hypothetical protein